MRVQRKVTWTNAEGKQIKRDALIAAAAAIIGKPDAGQEYEVEDRDYYDPSVEIVDIPPPAPEPPPGDRVNLADSHQVTLTIRTEPLRYKPPTATPADAAALSFAAFVKAFAPATWRMLTTVGLGNDPDRSPPSVPIFPAAAPDGMVIPQPPGPAPGVRPNPAP